MILLMKAKVNNMPKNIVICLDGTTNQYGDNNTNVVRLYSLLEKNDQQITYYDPGVGTMPAPTARSKLAKRWSKLKGKMVGAGLFPNIEEAYHFLMNNYDDGDDVYVFGFSRGAYTARALAALIAKCGLLDRGNENLVHYLMDIFRFEKRWHVHRGFRKTFSRKCEIHTLGLWDTVKSVGRIYNPTVLEYTSNNPIVRNVYHAVAIDERRAFFRQNMWGKARQSQQVKQVWFPGSHGDIGGGYPNGESGPALISLDWMLKQVPDLLLNRNALGGMFEKRPPSIDKQGFHSESEKFFWKVLEFLPRTYRDPRNSWKTRWKIYRSAPRHISEGSIIHQSVFDRHAVGRLLPENLPNNYSLEPW
ncbi:MAG: hypothetical protein COA41_07325 [Sphingopyxis sp.]|nr:MAG: hypothetical protein COA41_07325 [Sphingopyxis sp.]